MLDQVSDIFDIQADYDLDLMQATEDLYDVTSRIMLSMRDVLRDVLRADKPDVVLVHGDTTNCFAAGIAALYGNVFHSGTSRLACVPEIYVRLFPEEANRSLACWPAA